MMLNTILAGDFTPATSATAKNTFFKLTPEISEKLIRCNLSKNEMKLWLYLVAIAPFGDRQYTYSATDAIATCNLKKTSYFTSKAKLQRLELIDFSDGETKFTNKIAPVAISDTIKSYRERIVRKNGQASEKTDSGSEKRTIIQKNEPLKAETLSGQSADSLQTIQNNLESTDNIVAGEKFSEKEENIEASQGTEPTGILEEPQIDPIAQIQQEAAQLLDKREIFDSLRLLGIETNESVRAAIKKHAANVPAAIAHIKQRYDNREKFRNITGAFVKACKEGTKPIDAPATWGLHAEVNPPTSEQLAVLDDAKSRGAIRDYFLSSDNICKVVLPNGFTQMPWWEWLAASSQYLSSE